jgi:hypothetical protein
MTPQEKRLMISFAARFRQCTIQAEKDPEKFSIRIKEINDLLEKRELVLKERWAKDPLGLNQDTEEKAR